MLIIKKKLKYKHIRVITNNKDKLYKNNVQ